MKTLSYTQEYLLCAFNGKGSAPALKGTEVNACVLAGCITELAGQGYIVRAEKNKLIAGRDWDDSLPYLKPLYEKIVNAKKPLDTRGVAEVYIGGFSQKPLDELMAAIGASLVEAGYAEKLTNQGLLGNKTKYMPKAEAVKEVIEKVRIGILGDGTVAEGTAYLASMLDKSGIIRDYFSKVEAEGFKKRMKEIRKSGEYASIKEVLDYVDEVVAMMIAVRVVVN